MAELKLPQRQPAVPTMGARRPRPPSSPWRATPLAMLLAVAAAASLAGGPPGARGSPLGNTTLTPAGLLAVGAPVQVQAGATVTLLRAGNSSATVNGSAEVAGLGLGAAVDLGRLAGPLFTVPAGGGGRARGGKGPQSPPFSLHVCPIHAWWDQHAQPHAWRLAGQTRPSPPTSPVWAVPCLEATPACTSR